MLEEKEASEVQMLEETLAYLTEKPIRVVDYATEPSYFGSCPECTEEQRIKNRGQDTCLEHETSWRTYYSDQYDPSEDADIAHFTDVEGVYEFSSKENLQALIGEADRVQVTEQITLTDEGMACKRIAGLDAFQGVTVVFGSDFEHSIDHIHLSKLKAIVAKCEAELDARGRLNDSTNPF